MYATSSFGLYSQICHTFKIFNKIFNFQFITFTFCDKYTYIMQGLPDGRMCSVCPPCWDTTSLSFFTTLPHSPLPIPGKKSLLTGALHFQVS